MVRNKFNLRNIVEYLNSGFLIFTWSTLDETQRQSKSSEKRSTMLILSNMLGDI